MGKVCAGLAILLSYVGSDLYVDIRSVHNTRIERLWYDVTQGFGGKWKQFFMELETHYGLDPDRSEHIWLLHHLFLSSINQDAQEWAEAWNSHTLHLRGEPDRSPKDIFFFDMLQRGPQGLQSVATPDDEDDLDLSAYGVDWQVLENQTLMSHFHEYNSNETTPSDTFSSVTTPVNLSHIEVPAPDSYFTADQIHFLNERLSQAVDCTSRDMLLRREVWKHALEICSTM